MTDWVSFWQGFGVGGVVGTLLIAAAVGALLEGRRRR